MKRVSQNSNQTKNYFKPMQSPAAVQDEEPMPALKFHSSLVPLTCFRAKLLLIAFSHVANKEGKFYVWPNV